MKSHGAKDDTFVSHQSNREYSQASVRVALGMDDRIVAKYRTAKDRL